MSLRCYRIASAKKLVFWRPIQFNVEVIEFNITVNHALLSQYYLLKDELNISSDWIIYSFAGLIIGVGGSFVFILLTTRVLGLIKSHIYSFPISLFVLTSFQAFLLKNTFSNLLVWPLISIFGLAIAAILLFAINSRWDLAFDLLGDRRPELNKLPVWGFTGAVIGLIYGLITGYGLKT